MIEIVAITDGHLGGGVDEQVASKVVVRCEAQVEQSPHDATVAEAFRAPLHARQVTRLAL